MARFRRTRGKAGHSSAALFYKKIKLIFFSLAPGVRIGKLKIKAWGIMAF